MTAGEPLYGVQRRERILAQLREKGSVSVSVLARQLGVSELTVRRDVNALAQQGLVTRVHGGATLRSVLDTTRAPASGPTPRYVIGMVVPSLDYYWPQIVNGARAEAARLRTTLLLRASTYDARDQRRQVEALLRTPALDGLIVAPDTTGEGALDTLRWLDALPVPVVLAERRVPAAASALRLDSVASDHEVGAALAVRHLREAGHTRIGLFTQRDNPSRGPVEAGWWSALETLDLPRDAARLDGIRFDAPGRDEAMDEALELLERTRTSAVIVLPDPQALALEQHAVDRGIRVPRDLAIVAYDDDVARFGDPAITAIRPPKESVGREAVRLLVSRIEADDVRPTHRVRLGPELHVRQSSLPSSIDPASVGASDAEAHDAAEADDAMEPGNETA
ncbi:substrate-binding domain-containing protein [Cnuibacter sp. UC19_7]|uniref:substrate-binding domain-containing protein n=1 Tax=Cnuibacter sp. UC19_7 TaxID=3350166 RepID=UPI00366AC252